MDSITIIRWLIGLLGVSIIVGSIVSYLWYALLCWLMGVERKVPFIPQKPLKETGQFTGIVERLFFTIAIGTEMGGTAIAMIAWITIKNTSFWFDFQKKETSQRAVSFFSSFGSLLIAIIGAEICKGTFF